MKRPKRRITHALIEELQKIEPENNGETNFVVIARRIVQMAKTGAITEPLTLSAFREIADRVEGKAIAAIELSGPDQTPIETITEHTTAIEASRRYQKLVAADHTAFVDPGIEEADDAIDKAARRLRGEEDE